MSPQLRRFAPLLLIVAVLFVVLPLLRHSHKSGLSDADKAQRTKQALALIDAGEQRYATSHDRYTAHLADLVPTSKALAGDLAIGIATELDISSSGHTYLARVESDVLSLVRARTGPKLNVDSCLILKKSSGVNCSPVRTK